jgi:hypothetical protein
MQNISMYLKYRFFLSTKLISYESECFHQEKCWYGLLTFSRVDGVSSQSETSVFSVFNV